MDFLSLFLKINALLAVSSLVVFIINQLSRFQFFKFSYLYRLQISYLLVVLSLVFPIAAPFISVHVGVDQVTPTDLSRIGGETFWLMSVTEIKGSLGLDPKHVHWLSNLFMILLVMGVLIFSIQLIALYRKSKRLKVFKKLGSVHLTIQAEETSPYVYSLFTKKYIVLPKYLLNDKLLLSVSLKHELQHIRQQDTHWVYLLNFVLLSFYVNPLVHFLIRSIKQTQELACDEELVINKKVKFKSYIQSLLKIAELVQERKSAPFFANTILREGSKSNLRERVEMMIKVRKNMNKGYLAGVLLFVSVFVMGASAFAVKDVDLGRKKRPILLEITLLEEGKVISRPKLVTLEGEEGQILINDSSGNGISMGVVGWVYGDRVEMKFQRSIIKNHIAGASDVFNVEVQNKVQWTMANIQDGKNLSVEVTPYIDMIK
jgi:beta-lactamase regulating signal transducer with metallopeptidase domain